MLHRNSERVQSCKRYSRFVLNVIYEFACLVTATEKSGGIAEPRQEIQKRYRDVTINKFVIPCVAYFSPKLRFLAFFYSTCSSTWQSSFLTYGCFCLGDLIHHKPFWRYQCQAGHFCWREQDSHNTGDFTPYSFNHLQMKLQRQYLLLSYFKILSVDPAGLRTRDLPHDNPMLNQMSHLSALAE